MVLITWHFHRVYIIISYVFELFLILKSTDNLILLSYFICGNNFTEIYSEFTTHYWLGIVYYYLFSFMLYWLLRPFAPSTKLFHFSRSVTTSNFAVPSIALKSSFTHRVTVPEFFPWGAILLFLFLCVEIENYFFLSNLIT